MNSKIHPTTKNSLVEHLSLQWDLRLGPYRAFFSKDEKYLNTCRRISQKEVFEEGLFAICQDTHSSEIVACLYLEDAIHILDDFEKMTAFNLLSVGKERLEKMVVLSDLSYAVTENTTLVAQVLISHCFIEVLKTGGQAILSDCDVGYFSMYKRLGMRPIGTLYKSPSKQLFIPMILHPDEDYLNLTNSLILHVMRGVNFDLYRPLCDWYYKLVRDNNELQVGSAYYPTAKNDFEGHETLTDGLSEAGKTAFLKNAMVVNCREDEVLMTETDGGNSFGFIQKGTVKIVIGGQTVVLLTQGDILGEIGFILKSKRTAEVIAVSANTEVVLFSANAIDNLDLETDKTAIWHNLAKVLAQRVVMTNKLLA